MDTNTAIAEAAATTDPCAPVVVRYQGGFVIRAMGGEGRLMVGYHAATATVRRLPNWKGSRKPKVFKTWTAAARICAEMTFAMENPWK